jgi:DeoR/GlpR family transcriptional regulator of sugar metabolism
MEKSKLNSQERIFTIVNLLHENHVSGLVNKELAALVKTSEANICRDMALFERYGWVVRGIGGRWRLSPAFGGIAGHIMRSYQEARLRLTEEEAKYASEMQ